MLLYIGAAVLLLVLVLTLFPPAESTWMRRLTSPFRRLLRQRYRRW